MPATFNYAIVMLAAGVGIPILAALNAALGSRIGSPASAATVLFTVAFTTALIATILTGTGTVKGLATAPKHLYLAGVLVAFYVLSITWIAPTFGVGNAVFFVLLGQLVSAALIDHFGLFGAREATLSAARVAGIVLMAGGVFLTQKA